MEASLISRRCGTYISQFSHVPLFATPWTAAHQASLSIINSPACSNSSFRIWNSSVGIPSPPLALFVVMLSKAHLTSHSRMSGSRSVIRPYCLLKVDFLQRKSQIPPRACFTLPLKILVFFSQIKSFFFSFKAFVYSCHSGLFKSSVTWEDF